MIQKLCAAALMLSLAAGSSGCIFLAKPLYEKVKGDDSQQQSAESEEEKEEAEESSE